MKNNRAEEFLNFEMEPSREVWKRIESNLPAKKKKRWFIFFLLAAIVAGGVSVLYLKNDDVLENNAVNNSDAIHQNSAPVSVTDETVNSTPTKSNSSSTEITASSSRSTVENKSYSPQINKTRSGDTSSDINKSTSKSVAAIKVEKDVLNTEVNSQPENNFADVSIAGSNSELNDVFLASSIRPVIESENFQYLIERQFPEMLDRHLSRLSFYVEAGRIFTVNPPSGNANDENNQVQIDGVSSLFLNAGVRYDISTRIRLSLGVAHSKSGLIQEGYITIKNEGPPGSVETYVINTSLGNIAGSGTDFNTAFFGNADSLLFPPLSVMASAEDSIARRAFRLRQEFSFIEIPLTIVYKPAERRFTPFAGLLFTTGFLSDQKTFLNGNRIAYEYEQDRADVFFSAGITGGVDCRLTSRVGIYVCSFFRFGLNELIQSSGDWKPDQVGVSGGVNYRIGR